MEVHDDARVRDLLHQAGDGERADPDLSLKLARRYMKLGDYKAAWRWIRRATDHTESFMIWNAAAALFRQLLQHEVPPVKRTARCALLGSYTTTQLATILQLAAMREGIHLDLYESDYGQYRQDILDPDGPMYAFHPDFVLLAVHARDVALLHYSDAPGEDIERELTRWTSLWNVLAARTTARIIMHNFAVPMENAFGHLATRLPGSRASMLQRLNIRLGEAAGANVSLVDCDRLASWFGKRKWFDDKYWHISKQAFSLEASALVAKHTVAAMAAELGLTKKCLVLDLDNTLWGGVIGEDGLNGVQLEAGTPIGEAYLALQAYILDLKRRGVILAVCSKNNEADAKEVFERHPDMLLRLDDFAAFLANWNHKSENLQRIAEMLNIGLDSMVFLDDNPAEREIIRQMVPEVEVLPLPDDPIHFARALAEYPMFESAAFTADDAKKTQQYRAKARIAELQSSATSLEDFYRSLQMKAVIAPFDELHLPRIVQLIGKSNQFNLTTRRHNIETVRRFMNDPECVHAYLKLRDHFADHGLVSVLIANRSGDVMDIDTWLMSCRVIGRTVEAQMLAYLSDAALRFGCRSLRGTYIPTAKNAMVAEVYGKYGFVRTISNQDGSTEWTYDLQRCGPLTNEYIELISEAI